MADDDKDFDSVDAGIAPKITPLAAGFAKRQKLEDAEKAEQKKIQKAKQITGYRVFEGSVCIILNLIMPFTGSLSFTHQVPLFMTATFGFWWAWLFALIAGGLGIAAGSVKPAHTRWVVANPAKLLAMGCIGVNVLCSTLYLFVSIEISNLGDLCEDATESCAGLSDSTQHLIVTVDGSLHSADWTKTTQEFCTKYASCCAGKDGSIGTCDTLDCDYTARPVVCSGKWMAKTCARTCCDRLVWGLFDPDNCSALDSAQFVCIVLQLNLVVMLATSIYIIFGDGGVTGQSVSAMAEQKKRDALGVDNPTFETEEAVFADRRQFEEDGHYTVGKMNGESQKVCHESRSYAADALLGDGAEVHRKAGQVATEPEPEPD